MTTELEVKRIVAETTGVKIKDVKTTSRLANDLGLDSLDVLEITMFMEDRLNITIDENEFDYDKFITVQDLIDAAEKQINKTAS